MEKRQLGNTNLHIYPVVFAGNVFGWTVNKKKSNEILNGFSVAGFNCIDTADVHSRWASGNTGGESATIIGKWMKNNRNRKDIIVSTKVGFDMGNGKKGLSKKIVHSESRRKFPEKT